MSKRKISLKRALVEFSEWLLYTSTFYMLYVVASYAIGGLTFNDLCSYLLIYAIFYVLLVWRRNSYFIPLLSILGTYFATKFFDYFINPYISEDISLALFIVILMIYFLKYRGEITNGKMLLYKGAIACGYSIFIYFYYLDISLALFFMIIGIIMIVLYMLKREGII